MSYTAIAGIIPQYDQTSYYLKFYEPGTSNPISMAINALGAGGTLLAKAQLDVDGFPTTDGSTLFIPFIDQAYDAFLFPTATEADANDTINAFRVANNITTPTPSLPVADLVADYGAKGDATYQYEVSGVVTVLSGTDDTQALLDAMSDFASGTIGALTVPDGNFWIDSSQIDTPTGTTIIGAGSEATKFIMSTTTPNLNLFVGFYQGSRVSNLSFSGLGFIGSKVDDNTIGGTCLFTFGATNVYANDLACEGSKGLAWLGEDNVVGGHLFGTKDVFMSNLRVTDCKLFSVYVRGNETPDGSALAINDTNNINIDGLIVKGSNVGFVCAEGRPRNIKLNNYDCQFTDNVLQIEVSDDVKVTNFHISNATSVWNTDAPAPFKLQWQISGSSDVILDTGYIDAQLQAFAFGTNDIGCDNVLFNNITTGEFFRVVTINVQPGADVNKGLFNNWSFTNGVASGTGTSFFQSDTADQAPANTEIAYWRDWKWSNWTWNDTVSNPIVSVACMGTLTIDDKCVFNGKPPRALNATNITFDATVRANGDPTSSIQFRAIDGLDASEPKVLRLNGNYQIEGEVKDIGFDEVHDNGSYDVRNASPQCRTSDAIEFNDSGAVFTGFTGNFPILSDGVGTYKALNIEQLPLLSESLTRINVYAGNSINRTALTDLDFAGEGGLIWVKNRDTTDKHILMDTERGTALSLSSDSTAADAAAANHVTAFNSDGFDLGTDATVNATGSDYVAWQFLKSAGFMDIVPYVGDGIAGRTVAIGLAGGAAVHGMSITKRLDVGGVWFVQHKDVPATQYMVLQDTNAVQASSAIWNDIAATATTLTLGNNSDINANLGEYISYNFAHAPENGIYCGSYVGDGGSSQSNKIVTGFAVDFFMTKASSATGNWFTVDDRRVSGADDGLLEANTTDAELANDYVEFESDGISFNASTLNQIGVTYVFMAIKMGVV